MQYPPKNNRIILYMDRETKDIYKDSSGVIELKNKDFSINSKKVTNKNFKNKNGLIVFYAPWCNHCQKMAEMWSDLSVQFKNIFILGAVNCEDVNNYPIRNKLKIRMYPTVKYVTKNGTLYNYEGKMDKDDIIYFITSRK